MENKFKQIRQELDTLGYVQKLVPECVPLVQRLLLDLYKTTENLRKYMKISQCALEERDLLELGVEPYKCDNAKLIRECNDLHQGFIHFKEHHEKTQRDLRHQIATLQDKLDKCYLEKSKLMSHIQNLEKEKVQRGTKVSTTKNANKAAPHTQILNENVAPAKSVAKPTDLEAKHSRLMEENLYLRNQIDTRDKEIARLLSLLEGGRPYEAVSKECCYKNIDSQMTTLQDEITRLKTERHSLQAQLKEAVAKQHDAMRRALHLVERNRQLEKEMKDVDAIALAVEAECNSTIQGNSEKVTRLQDRINESLTIIQNLERDKGKLAADLEAVTQEKTNLTRQLQNEQQANKKLSDRINALILIEDDLNMEIDRLTRSNADHKRNIVELESRENNSSMHETKIMSGHKKSCKKSSHSKSSAKSRSASEKKGPSTQEAAPKEATTLMSDVQVMRNQLTKLNKEKDDLVNNLDEKTEKLVALEEELEDKKKLISRLQGELKDVNKKLSERTYESSSQDRLLRTKEQNITALEQDHEKERRLKDAALAENKRLQDDLSNVNCECRELRNSLDAAKRQCEDLRRQLQLCESEVKRTEGLTTQKDSERSELLDQFRTLSQKATQLECNNRTLESEANQLKIQLSVALDHTAELEKKLQHRDFVVKNCEKQNAELTDKVARFELQLKQRTAEQENCCCELKQLRDLCMKLDQEKDMLKSELNNREDLRLQAHRETEKLNSEKDALRKTLDRERNSLEAVEKLLNDARRELTQQRILNEDLQREVSRLKQNIADLEDRLKRKLESTNQDQLLRAKEQDIAALEQDCEKERRLKEAALIENKRLQNDLRGVVCDCRDARNELDISKRQVEDLKRQLQHYVAEVKRTEDLISQKELERSELLDQFKNLSQEANQLENNNHTLETEATQSKIQLSVALDHTSELERKVQHQDSIIKSYEKQIAELSENVARLESQLKQHVIEQEHCESELKQMRDLCLKLDREKDVLKSERNTRDDRRSQAQKVTETLSSHREMLQKGLEQEKNSLESVERLLNEARRDCMEQRLLNQDLQREVTRLKQNIADLEQRLSTTAEQLDIYQGKAFEYSQQNKQLRKDIAKERFSRSRMDDNKGYYPSL